MRRVPAVCAHPHPHAGHVPVAAPAGNTVLAIKLGLWCQWQWGGALVRARQVGRLPRTGCRRLPRARATHSQGRARRLPLAHAGAAGSGAGTATTGCRLWH